VLQIVKDGHTCVYANVLHARFGFHLSSIYIEEEVLIESGKVDRSILQLRFLDNEGYHWVLLPRRYKAFGPNATLMATSTDHLSQPSDISSVQPPLLHSVKLECPNDLVYLSSDSSKDELPNVSLPTPTVSTHVSNSKCSEPLKSVFTSIDSPNHSSFSRPLLKPNTRECPNVM
jgi:hypothetical protein